jgi:hypothetical protein
LRDPSFIDVSRSRDSAIVSDMQIKPRAVIVAL